MNKEKIGQLTLENLEQANAFNYWMVEQFEKQLNSPILEIGSGIGNITKILLEKEHEVTATDIEREYLDLLTSRYGHLQNLRSVEYLDLESSGTNLNNNNYKTVLLINVLEHITNSTQAIQKAVGQLNGSGKIIVLVPAGQWLYCRLDSKLGHIKRYNKNSLALELTSSGLRVENIKYFNCMGMLGWFIWGKVLNGKYLNLPLIKTYERMMRVNRMLDKITRNRIGLSLIAVATQK